MGRLRPHTTRMSSPRMWPKKYIALLLALWLVLDYRLYAPVYRQGYPILAVVIVVLGLGLAHRRRFEQVRLRMPRREDWQIVGGVLGVLTLTLIPLGLGLGFIHFNPTAAHLLRALKEAIPIFVIIALPEEIIFRGVIQQTAQAISGSAGFAIALASTLFGLAHLHKGGPFPNWRYALLAGLAGVGYGLAFRRRGLMASSLTHALVDLLWRMLFR